MTTFVMATSVLPVHKSFILKWDDLSASHGCVVSIPAHLQFSDYIYLVPRKINSPNLQVYPPTAFYFILLLIRSGKVSKYTVKYLVLQNSR
jgi:hypothetical protein